MPSLLALVLAVVVTLRQATVRLEGADMPNIMLTYRCNLRCPYCFANEFVGESSEEISLEDFDTALEYLTKGAPVRVGLIGGEPTIHPHFDEILRRTIDNPRVASITVFTNGIVLGRYEDLIVHPKVSLLVNWNPRSQIGDKAFDRILAAVDELVFRRGMKRRLNLGLNLHGEEFDYSYMLELLERYDLDKVRVSLTVPDFPKGCGIDVFEYFKGFKSLLLSMFADMDRIGVLPYYDCNRPRIAFGVMKKSVGLSRMWRGMVVQIARWWVQSRSAALLSIFFRRSRRCVVLACRITSE